MPGASASHKPIVVVGDVIADVIVRPEGPRAADSDTLATIVQRPGGSGANVAAWLGHLGAPVRFAGRVGAADYAERGRELAAVGVHPRLAADPARATGTIVVVVGEAGERAMFTDRGANEALAASDLPPSLLDHAALLHVSGYALFAPGPRDATLELVRAAADRGVPVSVDCASESFLRQTGPARFLDWIAGAELCFANEAEAAVLTGLDDPSAMATSLASRHAVVAIKRGASGALVRAGDQELALGVTPATVVDPTGAGDAFCAGFLARWVAGENVRDCAASALATAAAALGRAGGRP